MRPDILQHLRLRLGIGMNPIRLHPLAVGCNTLEKKGRQRHLLLGRDIPVDAPEPFGVGFAIVRRKLHTDQQNPRMAGLRFRDHRADVMFHLIERETAQAVVTTEFDDNYGGLVLGKQLGQAGEATGRGVTTDAGVDDPVILVFPREPLSEQSNPAGLYVHAVCRAQTVAHDEQCVRHARQRNQPDQQQHDKNDTAHV